jgi:hypothetical protein
MKVVDKILLSSSMATLIGTVAREKPRIITYPIFCLLIFDSYSSSVAARRTDCIA